jgi:uncharacterized repeat protein (TIGR03803 family)
LVVDSRGTLYGTAPYKGPAGVIFKLSPDGTYIIVHFFTGTDGFAPVAGLMSDSKGNLFGTTADGGTTNSGVVFRLSPDGTSTGTYTVLHSFSGMDGASPQTSLYADKSGNLYGTTSEGGAHGAGTVFKLTGTGFVP